MARTHVALVVDDDADLRELIARLLATVGYDVVTAGDAAAAVREAERHAPGLVTADLAVPGAVGTSLVRALRDAVPDAEVLVVSGRLLAEGERDQLREDGADGFFLKPFSLREFREHARHRLERLRAA